MRTPIDSTDTRLRRVLPSHHRMSQPPVAHTQQAPADLPRVLGASQATAIVVGTIIGSGIFLVPREMMQDTGSSTLVYLAWIVGGLLSLFGAMTYAELASMLPYAGGEYVYLRGAYGDTPAFLYMWTWFAVAKPASIAAVTIGLARTLQFFPAFQWLSAPAPGGLLLWSQLFAIAVTWLITGLNYLGVKKAGDFQLVFTILKGVLILIVAGLCFASASGSWANFATSLPHAAGGFGGFMLALIATLWAYDGWNDLTMVAGEVRRPERTIPRAILYSVVAVAVIYALMTLSIMAVVPWREAMHSKFVVAQFMEALYGRWAGALLTLLILWSAFASVFALVLGYSRIPYAAALDGYFLKPFAKLHPAGGFPHVGLLTIGGLAMAASLLELEWVLSALMTARIVVQFIGQIVAVHLIRTRRPEIARPFRIWLYPLPSLVALAGWSYIFATSGWRFAIYGLLVLASGVAAFAFWRRGLTAAPRSS